MSLEKAVRSVLVNDATVAALVVARVYPQRRPTGTLEGETINSLRLEMAVDIDETNEPAGEFGYFRTILDFVIWHQ